MSRTGAFKYWNRTIIHSGAGTVLRLPYLFDGLGGRRVFLISDPGLKEAGIVDRVTEVFDLNRSTATVHLAGAYLDIAVDAEITSVNAALKEARRVAADSILAVGGGSVQDAAKVVKVALFEGAIDASSIVSGLLTLKDWPESGPTGIPHVGVATTAGTGAEVTNGAVIFNNLTGVKHGLIAPWIEPDIAVLDATLTTGLPHALTVATAADALTHAIEVLALPSATSFVVAHAQMAVRLIFENLPRVVEDPADLNARGELLNASAMACNALVNLVDAYPVHNISHALGALYHIHHGEANGVILPAAIETMKGFYEPTAARLASVVGVSSKGDAEATLDRVANRIWRFLEEVGHPTDFKRHHIPEADIDKIVTAVAQDPLAMLYPIPTKDVRTIVDRVLAGPG